MKQPQVRFKSGAWRGIFYHPHYRNGNLHYREEWTILRDPYGNAITNEKSRVAAERALRRIERERLKEQRPVNGEDMTLDDACAAFLEAREGTVKDATLRAYKAAFALLRPVAGEMRVQLITAREIEAYQSSLVRARYESRSVRSYMKAIGALLNWLVDVGLLTKNPASRVRPVRVTEKRRHFLTWEDAPRLITAVDSPEYQAGVGLAIYAGLRLGEILALRWENVDAEGSIIHIRNTIGWSTKSGKARETVIMREMQQLLHVLPRRGPMVVSDPRHGTSKTAREQGFVRSFKRARERAGLPDALRFHDLRGSFATELLQRFPPAVVQQILGHADVQTTMKFYSRIDPQRAVEIVKTGLGERG